MIFNFKSKDLLEEKEFKTEKELQNFISENCNIFFGIKVIKNEYEITFFDSESYQQQNGRIDTLGIDENGAPVIIEYKLDKSNNLINQALYYLDWLRNNKRQYELEIEANFKDITIDWYSIRVICIAKNFNKYDYNAIRQIDANVELYKYKKYDEILELVEVYKKQNQTNSTNETSKKENSKNSKSELEKSPKELQTIFEKIMIKYIDYYGEDITINYLKDYIAFKTSKNILTIVPQRNSLKIYTNDIKEGKRKEIEDVSNKGHWGTGNYCFYVKNEKDYKKLLEIVRW
ncbi:MAG: hypothetical protein ACK5HR_00195 [Mycoplasmatales bacterium]